MKKMSIKKALIILAVVAVLVFVAVAKAIPGSEDLEYSTLEIKAENLVQTVSETGTVKAREEIDLSFLNTGKVNKINISIGDRIEADQVLAELDFSGLEIRRQEAEANLELAERNLQKLLAGATREEVAIEQASVDQARASHDSAKSEYERTDAVLAEAVRQAGKALSDLENKTSADKTTQEQAIETAEDNLADTKALYRKEIDDDISSSIILIDDKTKVANTALDKVDTIVNDDDAKDLISKKNPLYLDRTKSDYILAKSETTEVDDNYLSLSFNSEPIEVTEVLEKTKNALSLVFSALKNCFSALENSVTSSGFTQTELDTMKSTISTQQTAVAAAITAMDTKIQDLNSSVLTYDTKLTTAENTLLSAKASYNDAILTARNALSTAQLNRSQQLTLAQSKINSSHEAWLVAKARYSKITAPANNHDVKLDQARIKQAQASLDSINKQIEDSVIKSKISGVVTDIKYEEGEQVLSGSAVLTVLGESKFDIEVLISEADIAKVAVGDKTEITLDAYSDDDLMYGEITFVEPAETVIQDVIYYKVKIVFDPGKMIVKSGMTANVTITTAEKNNVVSVPSRAIIDKNGEGKFVRMFNDGQVQENKVITGLRGDGGVVEIVEGVKVGDIVVTSVKEKK